MLTKADRSFLKELQRDLWPESHLKQQGPVALKGKRPLLKQEWKRVQEILATNELVVELWMSSMFGGCGISLYEQGEPLYPGVPLEPEFLLSLEEENIPVPKGVPAKVPGSGRDDVWETFTAYTHTKANKALLKLYGLRESKDRYHYEY